MYPKTVTSNYHQPVQLQCNSVVEVKWYFQHNELPDNVMLYSAVAPSDAHRLVIVSLDASTEGSYQCIGRSNVNDKYSYFYSESFIKIGTFCNCISRTIQIHFRLCFVLRYIIVHTQQYLVVNSCLDSTTNMCYLIYNFLATYTLSCNKDHL